MAKTPFNFIKAMMARYPEGEYALFFELASGTGNDTKTKADAVVMSLWPSRGLEIHGFELKVQRSDWLREKKTPAKAETIAKFCDYWWLVTPDNTDGDTIAKFDEVPATWGLLLGDGVKMRVARKAKKLKAKPVTLSLMASIFREVQSRYVHRKTIPAMIENMAEAQKKSAAKRDDHWEKEYLALAKRVASLYGTYGFDPMNSPCPERIRKAYELVQTGLPEDLIARFEYLQSQADQVAGTIKAAVEKTRAFAWSKPSLADESAAGARRTEEMVIDWKRSDQTGDQVIDPNGAGQPEPQDMPDE